jgi:hypothetical protein
MSYFETIYSKKVKLLHPFTESKLDVRTPSSLISNMCEMVHGLTKSDTEKYLDPACGRGGILVKLYELQFTKTFSHIKSIEERNKKVIASLYGYEINPYYYYVALESIKQIQKYFGVKTNITPNIYNCNFLNDTILNSMKKEFVVITNPPYQDSSKDSQNSGLWMKFLDHSKKISKKYIVFVSPISWMSGSTTQKSNLLPTFTKNLVYLNLDTENDFINEGLRVGSTFCDYILDLDGSDIVEVKQNGIIQKINISNKLFLPKELNTLTLSILSKVFDIENKIGFSTKQRVTPSGNGNYDILHTNGNIIKNEKDSKNSGILKVVVNKSGYLNPKITTLGTSQNIYWAPITQDESESIVDFLNSKLVTVITQKMCKYSGFNSDVVMQNLPKIDFTKKYSDEDLYNEFKLSDEEKEYIRNYEL